MGDSLESVFQGIYKSIVEAQNTIEQHYVGEVKEIPVNELVKEFPFLEQEDLEEVTKTIGRYTDGIHRRNNDYDNNKVQVLYFNYKTYMNEVYKVKETSSGASKIILRDDTFDPPVEEMTGEFGKISRSLEVLYEGVLNKSIIGSSYNSLIQIIHKEYGPSFSSYFIDCVQFVTNKWLLIKCFTIGLGDCLVSDSKKRARNSRCY